MKVLYIGNERRNAQAVATALRSIAPKVTLLWAHSLDECARCLEENRGLAALVMDAQVHAGKWPSSLKDLRSLEIRPAIVIVVPEGTRPKFDSLGPLPDGYVTNGQTFLRDLPLAVTGAVTRVRGSQPASLNPSNNAEPQQHFQVTPERTEDDARLERTARVDLEQKLADVTAAFQDAQQRQAAAMAAALAAGEVAATEQLTEQEREFQAQIALELDKRRTVEEMLAEAASALEEAERRYASALTNAATQTRELEHARALVAERQRHFDRELSQKAADRDKLEERLITAKAALDQSRHEHESATADVARLTQRETDLSAQLAHVEGVRNIVEGKLSDALREIAEAREYAARQRDAAEERRADLELRMVRETDARLASERLEYENRLAEMQTEYERLGQARAAADKNVQRLRADLTEATRVLEDARRESQNTIDRLSTEHATALAALIAERDQRLKEQAVRHDVSLRASERARTELQERLHEALATGRHEIEQVQEKLMATVEALEATLRRRDILQTEVVRSSEPHGQREESRAKNLRLLEQPTGRVAVQRG